MGWLAVYLYLAGMPLALHHIDNVLGSERAEIWRVTTTIGWPIFWWPLYLWALVID